MKKWIMVAAMALSMVVTAQQAQAGSDDKNFTPYIGIGGGLFSLEFKLSDPLVGSAMQRNPTWGSFIKGGIDLNNYFGVELRLGTTGKPSSDWGAGLPVGSGFITLVPGTVTTQADNFFSFLGKLQAPIGDSYHFYALLGGTRAKYSATLNLAGLSATESATKTGFSYGFGVDVNTSENTSLGVEWMEYWTNVEIAPASSGSTDTASFRGLSLTYDYAF